ncbi:MAG: hypothetical protein HKO92_06495 [Flavobacteriaceae bacterium]|nr:hypothetical protein [Flavobacteriaceae bacterium]
MKNKVEEAAAKLRSWKEAKKLPSAVTPVIEIEHDNSKFTFVFKQKEGRIAPNNQIIDVIQVDDHHDFKTIMMFIRSSFPSVIVKGVLNNNFDLKKLKSDIDKLRPKK